MRGFAAFVRKEITEIVRTWRILVLPGMALLFALTGPALAKYTPEILRAVAGDQLGNLKLLPPTYLDAYGQWIKNLSQIVLFALVIIYGGLVSSERKSGTAILVLTKPVSRSAFVIAKAVVHMAFVALTIAVGTALTWGMTAAMFPSAPGSALWKSTGAWLAFAVLFVGIMALLSVLVPSQAGAAGIGLGVYVVLGLASLWKPLGTYSPAGLSGAPASIAAGHDVAVLWPILSAIALAAVCVGAAAALFRRGEL